jgi:hypothetical protein
MMLYEPFKTWWCCLNPRERTAIQLLIVLWIGNNEYCLQTQYTVVAFISGLASSILMDDFFKAHYGLTDGFIPNGDDPPIAVVFFDTTLWPLLYAFSLTDDFICDVPCKLLTFPL